MAIRPYEGIKTLRGQISLRTKKLELNKKGTLSSPLQEQFYFRYLIHDELQLFALFAVRSCPVFKVAIDEIFTRFQLKA